MKSIKILTILAIGGLIFSGDSLTTEETQKSEQIAAGSKQYPPQLIAAGSKQYPPQLIAAGSKQYPPQVIVAGSKQYRNS